MDGVKLVMVSSIICNLTRFVEFLRGKSSHVGVQFDSGLFVGDVSGTTLVHFDGKILQFVLKAVRLIMTKLSFHTAPSTMLMATINKANPLRMP